MGTLIGLLIAAAVGVWVYNDAQKHGLSNAWVWGVGVFLLLIVVLPAYFIVRYRHDHPKPPAAPAGAR